MGDRPTLNSRLRVLVAKTFRAERLYSSMRNAEIGRLSGTTQLTELANDIRAREWQRCHYQLRTALNEILGLGSNQLVSAEFQKLLGRFQQIIDESTAAIFQGVQALQDSAARQEFAHCLRQTVDLIRSRSRLQAAKAIVEEMRVISDTATVTTEASAVDFALQAADKILASTGTDGTPTNVIDFQKRAGSRR